MEDRFYTTSAWKQLRARVLARDADTCTVSRTLGGDCFGVLEVHHIQSRRDRPDLELDDANCATTCRRHHGQWEALRRALVLFRDGSVRCPHKHVTRESRRACEERRRERILERRLSRVA